MLHFKLSAVEISLFPKPVQRVQLLSPGSGKAWLTLAVSRPLTLSHRGPTCPGTQCQIPQGWATWPSYYWSTCLTGPRGDKEQLWSWLATCWRQTGRLTGTKDCHWDWEGGIRNWAKAKYSSEYYWKTLKRPKPETLKKSGHCQTYTNHKLRLYYHKE